MILRLLPLSNEYFPALICQMLKVSQISKVLAAGMMFRSFGNPGWLLILLKKLKEEQVVKLAEIGTSKEKMHVPPKELTTARKLSKKSAFQSPKYTNNQSKVLSKAISKTMVSRSVVNKSTS
jgi:hypothetical protein